MKVYIAGKITGDPDYGAKFKRAEGALREEGHTVINPAVLPAGLDPADYGRICFAMLDSADAVAFLDDYMDSPGAALEHEYSEYTDKKTMYIGDEYRAFEDQRIAPADALRGPTREQVILCKDCQYWQGNNGGYPHPECRWGNDETPDEDDYCSFAERLEVSKNG